MQLKLWEDQIPYLNTEADTPNTMTAYLLETDQPLPCIVVYPGGGYSGRAKHEGEPIARFFNSRGCHAVVVDYRVAPNTFPAPLADAQRAIKQVRFHADEWKVDPNRVITLGFSAGGHLCASTILFDDVSRQGNVPDEVGAMSCMPNGAILCYPVISVEEGFGHINSGKRLLGDRYEQEKADFSLAHRVTDQTPPVFLWHTSEDKGVNVKNSLVFAEELRNHHIPFELHVFPHGPHGLGLAEQYEDVRQWAPLAADWVHRNF